jgi:two-component system, sensor histidine kinase PhcS
VKHQIFNNQEIAKAYEDYEHQLNLRFLKVGCYLVAALMPVGMVLDWLVYPEQFWLFFRLRLACAALSGLIWLFLHTQMSQRFHRLLCLSLAWLPSFFICWMIYEKDGANSPYYAGLNLILLCIPLVVRWSIELSVVGTVTVVGMYLAACALHDSRILSDHKMVANNLYFLLLTGMIVIISGWVHRTLRIREFSLSYELNKSKRDLETSNAKLFEQNTALEKANREIKEAEMQLVQSEKMASLGRFSAGLMHDVLNPLNYSRTALFVLKKKARKLPTETSAETEAIVSDIEDGLTRVNDIVSGLRSFTHPGEQASEDIDLVEIFDMSLRWGISNEAKERNILLRIVPTPGQKAWATRNQLITVIVNLLENSIDALAEKQFANGERAQIEVTSRAEGDRTKIIFHDNGPGIAPENLARVFDPFFTTKEVGKGTGLGLSICFGIVRGFGGTITAASQPGKFCEFIVDLPANETAARKTIQNVESLRL